MIITTLISQIKSIIDTITLEVDGEQVKRFKDVFAYPTEEPENYPAIIFFPDRTENTFNNSQQNFKVYRFKLWVVAGITTTADTSTLFETILPNACDSLMEAFDTNWCLNSIDGHRVWANIDLVKVIKSDNDKGTQAVGEFDIVIKMITNN